MIDGQRVWRYDRQWSMIDGIRYMTPCRARQSKHRNLHVLSSPPSIPEGIFTIHYPFGESNLVLSVGLCCFLPKKIVSSWQSYLVPDKLRVQGQLIFHNFDFLGGGCLYVDCWCSNKSFIIRVCIQPTVYIYLLSCLIEVFSKRWNITHISSTSVPLLYSYQNRVFLIWEVR